MKPKAQAGLEYLMTYGWALVLIVTVAGVLFFVMAPPTESFVCRSSDPTKIIVKQYNLPFDSAAFLVNENGTMSMGWGHISGSTGGSELNGELVLQNATGGPITLNYSTTEMHTPNYSNPDCPPFFLPGVAVFFGPVLINGTGTDELENGTATVQVPKGGNIKATQFGLMYYTIYATKEECSFEAINPASVHKWDLRYIDQFGYEKDVTITCQGWPPRT